MKGVSPDYDSLWDDYYAEEAEFEMIEKPKRAFGLLKAKKKSDVLHNMVRNKFVKDITKSNKRREDRDLKPKKVDVDKQYLVKNYDKFMNQSKETAVKFIKDKLIPQQKRYSYKIRKYEKITVDGKIKRKLISTKTAYYKASDIVLHVTRFGDEQSPIKSARLINSKNKRFVSIPKKWRWE